MDMAETQALVPAELFWAWVMAPDTVRHASLPVTLKVKVSLKAGFNVFRWTLVSYFFFLSGRRKTLT